ncbi:hypothetical protein ACWD4F_36900 [Streptomyces aureus]|uniref:hypothetical protein n=1 Tax=Streptomyces aureus TaxID=193461 RepID=UPI00055E2732|nr:hypothetical protein [Streptomyces aureus]
MSTARTRRFAPGGLLERRGSAPAANGCYGRTDPPRPAAGSPWFPDAPLPPALLRLPAGFEPRGS